MLVFAARRLERLLPAIGDVVFMVFSASHIARLPGEDAACMSGGRSSSELGAVIAVTGHSQHSLRVDAATAAHCLG